MIPNHFNVAEDILLNNRHQQNASSGNHPGFEDGKTLVKALGNVHNQEKMVAECFAKPDNTVSSSCCLQVDTKANESGLLAETGKEESNLIPDLKNEGTCCPGTKKPSPQSLSPDKGHGSNSFDVSFGQLPSPRFARPSLNRCSLKLGMNRRKSLPPLHLDISELSKAISLDMPETERMAVLLLSSFQYSAQKLECSLRQTEGFNTKTFEQNVNMLSEELRLHTKKLILDGTLQKCFEDPRGGLSDPALNASISALKENIVRFSEEGQAWDKLLQTYQKNAEEITSCSNLNSSKDQRSLAATLGHPRLKCFKPNQTTRKYWIIKERSFMISRECWMKSIKWSRFVKFIWKKLHSIFTSYQHNLHQGLSTD
ncbi:kinetochore-associated protein DSN1 homolog isoform X4 [Sceloporus undulatus]|uniref:kinetochore-associated protein DSN1 homolog isoform X4 n=1 Tax=Sceloporus undulatus TaxID=8520 RepID=UPI001C4D8A19|nr:kinetochore-associated protein DSN1 homolog isoform X4 [Sceloporus undulatus]